MFSLQQYRTTVRACYVGYVTQAAVNNLAPLFFVIFQKQYGISTWLLGNLILLNFGVQLVTDFLSVHLINRFGYRRMIVIAHASAVLGLIALGMLPRLLPSAYAGLIPAVVLYAFGGGLLEVAVSPVVDALPGEEKESAMSLLHSFYSWGQMAVVLFSTLILSVIGEQYWYWIPVMWAVVPLANMIAFSRVPLADMVTGEESAPKKELFRGPFFLFMLFMLAAGAAELTVSQWASLFAETGLGISKTAGDLLGPCLFALTMGAGRTLYGIYGARWDIRRALLFTGVLCVCSYLLISLSPWPWLSLLGCALCGFSVSLMWPGTVSFAAGRFPKGGALLFGTLALCGDVGCSVGPWLAGSVAAAPGGNLKIGILVCTIFPLLLVAGLLYFWKREKGQQK